MKTIVKDNPTKTVEVTVEIAKPIKMISTDDLVKMLMLEKGANIISFTHCTTMSKSGKMVQKDRKDKSVKNPYWGDCFKTQDANGMINFHYDTGVLRRLEKEGKSADDFKQGESWHMPILRTDNTLTPFCCKKSDPRQIYIRFMLNTSTNVRYHTANGKKIETENVKPYLCERSDYSNQGLEKPLIFQVWGIDDITHMTINKQRYQITR